MKTLGILALLSTATAQYQSIFYLAIFQIPAPIYHIKSTYTVPPVPQSAPGMGTLSFWMGMQPANGNAIFQNVVADQGTGDGSWELFPM